MPTTSPARAFDDLAARFLAEYLRLEPVRATEAGAHAHDATWPDVTVAGDRARRAFAESTLAALAALPKDGLDEPRRVDAKILDNLTVRVGGAQKGHPAIQSILQLN